jgi:hypothetical protein
LNAEIAACAKNDRPDNRLTVAPFHQRPKTLIDHYLMSALPPKADIDGRRQLDVRFVPKADIRTEQPQVTAGMRSISVMSWISSS